MKNLYNFGNLIFKIKNINLIKKMKKHRYSKIGTLQLFKPDYLNENKKTLLSSNIIKEYLRKRKGKYFYKVNFMKNKFKFESIENIDIINRKIQLKLIEDNYKEMKYEINKRLLDKNLEDNKIIKLSNHNNNFFSTRNKSRNNNIFTNINYFSLNEYKHMEKNSRFRKINSETNLNLMKTKNELNTKLIDSILFNTYRNRKKLLKPLRKKYLFEFKKNININNRFLSNSPQNTNRTEINYNSFNENNKEIISDNNISNNLNNDLKNIEYSKDENQNLYEDDKERKLRLEYKFFRINEENNLPLKKFLKVQKALNSHKNIKINNKFHLSYVHYYIDNIKRKEKAAKILKKKERDKID